MDLVGLCGGWKLVRVIGYFCNTCWQFRLHSYYVQKMLSLAAGRLAT